MDHEYLGGYFYQIVCSVFTAKTYPQNINDPLPFFCQYVLILTEQGNR